MALFVTEVIAAELNPEAREGAEDQVFVVGLNFSTLANAALH